MLCQIVGASPFFAYLCALNERFLFKKTITVGETKYIFVTGGVASSLGKGIISSSIGKLLQARGYKVTTRTSTSTRAR